MYFLHRNGETTGPFAPGRIAAMIAAGDADENDQVCAHGTEDWIPAYLVTGQPVEAAPRAPQPVGMKKSRPAKGASWLIGLAGLGFFVFFPWILGVPLGVILILMAAIMDRPRFLCGGCGNRIEKTSTICPACRARIR